MRIYLKKFGTTLTSREDGREAFAAIQPTVAEMNYSEKLELDFEGVNTFSPSWGDEFITPFLAKYVDRLVLLNTTNLSVTATLDMLEQLNKTQFRRSPR